MVARSREKPLGSRGLEYRHSGLRRCGPASRLRGRTRYFSGTVPSRARAEAIRPGRGAGRGQPLFHTPYPCYLVKDRDDKQANQPVAGRPLPRCPGHGIAGDDERLVGFRTPSLPAPSAIPKAGRRAASIPKGGVVERSMTVFHAPSHGPRPAAKRAPRSGVLFKLI